MNERLKRILLIVLFLAIIGLFGYLIYRFFFKPPTPAQPPVTPPGVIQGLPSAGPAATSVTPTVPPIGPGQLPSAGSLAGTLPANIPPSRTETLSSQTLTSLSLSPSGNGIRSYNPADGKFYRILPDGTMTPLSGQTFYSVQQVTWGNTTDKAILAYPDGSKILYDFTSGKQTTLPKHWEDFSFSPQDDQIAAKSVGDNESNRFLVIANPDGSNSRAVQDLGDNQDLAHVSWSPNNQIIGYSFTGDPVGFDQQAIVLLGKNQENFKNLIVDGRGFIPNWSPTGDQILYSVYNANDGYKPRLWVSGASGDNINANRRNLDLQTWADKCAWQSNTVIICAVPVTLEDGAGLQPDLASQTPDALYKIDLAQGVKVNLGVPDGQPTISQLVVSQDGKSVFYTDQSSGKLVKFSL